MQELIDPRLNEMESRIAESSGFIKSMLNVRPKVAIILGSGLGGLTSAIESAVEISYDTIPHFARSTAAGHQGMLVCGTMCGQNVIAMAGRFHAYEGRHRDEIVYPIHVFADLGVSALIVSNAAGAVNTNYRVGDIVVIQDHIDLMLGSASLRFSRQNGDRDVSTSALRLGSPYNRTFCEQALATARLAGFPAHPGTYLATLGPNYETRAEYRMMKRLGADVVGMSTVPEVREASRLGLSVLALSMVSNLALPDAPVQADHQEVLDAGSIAGPRMQRIVEEFLLRFNGDSD